MSDRSSSSSSTRRGRTGRAQWPAQQPRGDSPLQAEARFNVSGLPRNTSPAEIHTFFRRFGTLDYIRLHCPGNALVTFCPPPQSPEWSKAKLLHRADGTRYQLQVEPAPVSPRSRGPNTPIDGLPSKVLLNIKFLAFGIQSDDISMEIMRSYSHEGRKPIALILNLERGPSLQLQFSAQPPYQDLIRYRLEAKVSQITRYQFIRLPNQPTLLVFSLAYPPEYRREIDNIATSFGPGSRDWSSWKSYSRKTSLEQHLPTALLQEAPHIDLGRWLTYALEVDYEPGSPSDRAVSALEDCLRSHNIKISRPTEFDMIPPRNKEILHMLRAKMESTGSYDSVLDEMQAMHSDNIAALDFEVRYLLEACISQNILYEGTFTPEFIGRLITQTQTSRNILENALLDPRQQRFYTAMSIFDVDDYRIFRQRRTPTSCVLMHTLTVTPTTIRINAPSVEITNRVVRRFLSDADRFIRVRFADEDSMPVRTQRDRLDDEVYARVHRTLTDGIVVAGRRYQFLAYGNSQFTEHGAYFFAPTKETSVEKIRSWMGSFQHIKQVARYASRLGQCFSTTRAITRVGTQLKVEVIPDVQRDGFTFTDGVGKISTFLASMIAQDFGIGTGGHYPSVFQFRMGGDKGILVAVAEGDLSCQGKTIQVRPSQRKFAADSSLEIIRYSSFSSAHLNSQLILVMSALGVSTPTFQSKLRKMLDDINHAMHDDLTALRMLRANVDINQMTVTIARFLTCGLGQEPFVRGLLTLWRAWSIKHLKEKFKILVEEGAFLFGCVDETATLRGDRPLPQIYIQVPDTRPDRVKPFRVITGRCLLARNPSLHPGDIRVVEAVDCPQLRHLKNVVVLPQTGVRPLANMCAGGDLDGDDYMVIWDQSLLPDERDHDPMEYAESHQNNSAEVEQVTTKDIINFFVDYMKNNSLGQIAIAHRAWADQSPMGIKDPKCLKLAELHSQAVDFAKSGKPARMTPDLHVKKYPHWMNRPAHQQTYKSKDVLGVLYDDVERVEFKPELIKQHCSSEHMLCHSLEQCDIDFAAKTKKMYDEEVTRVMNQFGLRTEFEAYTAFAMETAAGIRDYEILQDVGSVMQNIKNDVKENCIAYVCSKLDIKKHECSRELLYPVIQAMWKVTSTECSKCDEEGKGSPRTFLSFAFVMANEVAELSEKLLAQAGKSCVDIVGDPVALKGLGTVTVDGHSFEAGTKAFVGPVSISAGPGVTNNEHRLDSTTTSDKAEIWAGGCPVDDDLSIKDVKTGSANVQSFADDDQSMAEVKDVRDSESGQLLDVGNDSNSDTDSPSESEEDPMPEAARPNGTKVPAINRLIAMMG